ncbi:MAG TPA: hypothetical protein VFO36_09555 [Nitrospiraceae bacterium]|nr:hypothetical protein [Nitrospiraceae bacterium]
MKGKKMIRNLKVLGLAIAAVLALSAVMASAAMAAEFTASSYPATITGSNTKGSEVFKTEGGNVECNSHFVSHSQSAASSTLTVTPTYTSCDAFGFLSATVNTEECSYVFHATDTITETEPVHRHYWRHHVDVVCPTGQSIKVTASTCKAEIKSQTGLTTVKTENIAGGSVTVTPDVSGIAYTVTQDGFLCPFGGTGNKTDGKYTGDVTVSRVGGGSVSVSGS